MAHATKAIEADPNSADAYAIRRHLYEKQGNRDKALADRKTSERLRLVKSDSDDLEAAFAAALHRCLARLVPGLE